MAMEMDKDSEHFLKDDTTEQAYDNAKKDMDTFIDESEDRMFLKTWISLWHDRCGFIFRDFVPTNASQINQAEVVHTSWVHRNLPNLSLLDTCPAYLRVSVVLDVELKEYERGSLSVGTSTSYEIRKKKERRRKAQTNKL
ncbi:Hypothetical predicted protein [Paramuricea clavata]|uniref:Uncharacterized protein n=1 Tax=Paramuricea clavata TaxID=317549 RepID=A0A6S7G3H5_PARCT|nr:Hypothetical predicted protein [Paramuricea clavata]